MHNRASGFKMKKTAYLVSDNMSGHPFAAPAAAVVDDDKYSSKR